MAPHHHHAPPAACCCSTSSYSSCHCTQSHPPQQDPLLLHLLQTQTPHYPKHPYQSQHQTQLLFHSLLSRIEALEASLHSSNRSRSSSSYSSLRDYAARVIQTHFRAHLVRRSRTLRQLKDLAFIKSSFSNLKSSVSNRTHFDFSSVSRKALSLLIKLDSIQSGDSFVRDGRRALSRELVRFLEFIEGGVAKRQGGSLRPVKNARSNVGNVRSVGRFRGSGGKCGSPGGLGKDEREMIGKLKERIEKIRGFARVSENEEEDVELEGFQHVSDDNDEEEEEESGGRYESGAAGKRGVSEPKVKKSVNFAEDENVFRVFSNSDDAASSGNGSDSGDDHEEQVDNCNEVEYARGFAMLSMDGDDELLVTGGSPKTSDAKRTPRGQMTRRKSHDQHQNEHLLFSPPLALKIDPKEEVVKRNKGVKILT